MNEDKDFQIDDVVIVSDQNHPLYELIFKVVGLPTVSNRTIRMEFLLEENSDKNKKIWFRVKDSNSKKKYAELFPWRLSLYRTQEINFIE